jgi:hypothetical protein
VRVRAAVMNSARDTDRPFKVMLVTCSVVFVIYAFLLLWTFCYANWGTR